MYLVHVGWVYSGLSTTAVLIDIIFYLNNIFANLNITTGYTDDIQFSASIDPTSLNAAEVHISNDVKHIWDWAISNQLQFHPWTCKIIYIIFVFDYTPGTVIYLHFAKFNSSFSFPFTCHATFH